MPDATPPPPSPRTTVTGVPMWALCSLRIVKQVVATPSPAPGAHGWDFRLHPGLLVTPPPHTHTPLAAAIYTAYYKAMLVARCW